MREDRPTETKTRRRGDGQTTSRPADDQATDRQRGDNARQDDRCGERQRPKRDDGTTDAGVRRRRIPTDNPTCDIQGCSLWNAIILVSRSPSFVARRRRPPVSATEIQKTVPDGRGQSSSRGVLTAQLPPRAMQLNVLLAALLETVPVLRRNVDNGDLAR